MENSFVAIFDEIWPKTLYYSTGQTWGEVLFKVFKYIPSTLQNLRVQYEYEYRFQ